MRWNLSCRPATCSGNYVLSLLTTEILQHASAAPEQPSDEAIVDHNYQSHTFWKLSFKHRHELSGEAEVYFMKLQTLVNVPQKGGGKRG